jgi:hypothetical protein
MCGYLRMMIAVADTCTITGMMHTAVPVTQYKELLCFEQRAVFRGSTAIHTQIPS